MPFACAYRMMRFAGPLSPSPGFCLAVGLLLLAAATSEARELYVATNGNDDSSGSIGEPWRTVDKAAGEAQAGDTVYIRAGTYPERLIPRSSGTQAAPIVYSAYPGEAATLDAAGLSGQGIVYINGVEHVQVFGLEVINGAEAGFWIIDSRYITVSGNRIYNTVSSGIIVSEFGVNDHIYIDNNEVELACNDGGQECISISKCDVFEVTRNHVFNGGPGTNGGEGIDAKFGSSNGTVAYNYVHHLNRQGLYADAWSIDTHDIDYFGNVVHDCQFGLGAASEQGGALYNISFHNNLVYDTGGPGMYILMSAGPLHDLHFVNNTVHHTGYEWGSGMWLNGALAENVIVRNNIFSNLAGEPFYVQQTPSSWTVDHNLAQQEQSGVSGGFIVGSAEYVNASAGDFHLQSTSPGIDSGSADTMYATSLGDLEQNARVQDGDCDGSGEIDLGAYEYRSPCTGGAGGSAGSGGSGGSHPSPDGVYELQNVGSGKCLEVAGLSAQNGANIQQWACGGGDHQRWELVQRGDGSYRIRALHSSKCMVALGKTAANGDNIQQGRCVYKRSKWHVLPVGGGHYELVSVKSGLCADIDAASGVDGANLQQWECNGTDAQRFVLVSVTQQSQSVASVNAAAGAPGDGAGAGSAGNWAGPGCSVARGSSAPASLGWALVVLLAVSLRRRRADGPGFQGRLMLHGNLRWLRDLGSSCWR